LFFIVISINGSYSQRFAAARQITHKPQVYVKTLFKSGSNIANQIALMRQPDEAVWVP
jgi:hypothetical protein